MFEFSLVEGVIIFILGASVGSFLDCLTYRVYESKSIRGRSFCDQCGHTLSVKDLFPFLSYLLLWGKCRYCQKKISVEHFFIELATGVVFLFFHTANLTLLPFFLFIASLLIFLFIYKARYGKVFATTNYLLIFTTLFYVFYTNQLYFFFSAAVVSLLFFFIYKNIRGAEFSFFMGLFLGFPNIVIALFISLFIGAIMRIMVKRKEPVLFLIAGTVVTHLFAEEIISFYLSII